MLSEGNKQINKICGTCGKHNDEDMHVYFGASSPT